MSSSFSFRIARPESQPSPSPSSSSRSQAQAHSKSARPPARAQWNADDSDSDADAPPPRDELVTGFDATGGLTSKEHKANADRALVIASIPNRDWREAATARGKKKKNKERYIPDAVGGMKLGGQGVPADARQKTQGGMGTRDVINDSVVVGGLELAAKKAATDALDAVTMDVDSPAPGDGEAERAAEVAKPAAAAETEEQRAIRELMMGDSVAAPAPLAVILPAAADERTAPLDEADAFRRDLLTRPDESTLDDYARVPVGQFGAALLRGMGWKEGTAASRTGRKGPVEAFVPTSRPALLGIGAKPIADILGEDKGKNGKPMRKDRREDMKFVPLVKRERETGSVSGSGKSTPALQYGTPQDSPQSARPSARRPSPPARPRESDRDRASDQPRERDSRDLDRRRTDESRGSKRPRSRDRGGESDRRRERSRSPDRRRDRDEGRHRDRDDGRDRERYREREGDDRRR